MKKLESEGTGFIPSAETGSGKNRMQQDAFPEGMMELSVEESAHIIGGESLWYWIGYGLGYATRVLTGG